MQQIDRLKCMLEIKDQSKDALLYTLLENSEAEFMDYCNRSDIPPSAESLITQIAVLRYNQTGAEGLTGQNYSGASESYITDYPGHIRSSLNRYRKVKLL